MDNKPFISVVVPVYGCDAALIELHERLIKTLKTITNDYEIVLVNDNSPDNSWAVIKKIAETDRNVKGIHLSRNFGQHYAISAGLENAKGNWIVVMDCDLQDQPEEIPKLFNQTKNNFEIVLAKRINRKDSVLKKLSSKLFYGLLSYLTDTKQDASVANFGIYHQNVIKAILAMKDSLRYFPAMVKWVGFNITSIEVDHSERSHGKSSYSVKKLIKLAIDIILSYSDKPLRLTVKLGFFISFAALVFAMIYLIKYFNNQIVVTGWTSLIVSVWFLSGIIIFVLGITGLYIGKTFEKVKQRPVFIIKEIINEK